MWSARDAGELGYWFRQEKVREHVLPYGQVHWEVVGHLTERDAREMVVVWAREQAGVVYPIKVYLGGRFMLELSQEDIS